MAEFRVVLEGLELDGKLARLFNDRIQKAVLEALADLDLTLRGKEKAVVAFRPHPDWYGLIAQVLATGELLEALPQLAELYERYR